MRIGRPCAVDEDLRVHVFLSEAKDLAVRPASAIVQITAMAVSVILSAAKDLAVQHTSAIIQITAIADPVILSHSLCGIPLSSVVTSALAVATNSSPRPPSLGKGRGRKKRNVISISAFHERNSS